MQNAKYATRSSLRHTETLLRDERRMRPFDPAEVKRRAPRVRFTSF